MSYLKTNIVQRFSSESIPQKQKRLLLINFWNLHFSNKETLRIHVFQHKENSRIQTIPVEPEKNIRQRKYLFRVKKLT